ncbi:DnaJ C-terminal domain-containing protein [Pseudoruegeria sp. HB172150]|uniref:DnaJ C-terminal domain-containing protein n=1 Tax=Pseudoruegeria sp. HB172150 TaxID=2721164 RepID=UPI0015551374
MSDDPYEILGVQRTASDNEIRKAYKKQAKELHPDLHPGDKSKEAAFQALSGAYDLLRDPDKRRRFDAGEIDAAGHEQPQRQYYRDYAGSDPQGRYSYNARSEDFEDFSDIFGDIFGRGSGRRTQSGTFSVDGGDLHFDLEIDFLDAALGAKQKLAFTRGDALEVTIPAGLREGQTLRLRGRGKPGIGGGKPGDALVTVHVRPHPQFSRDGNNIEVELPVSFDEAVLGGRAEVSTISGNVSMTIPSGVSSGHRLRLKGKGIHPKDGKAGDQFVRIRIVLPEKIDEQMRDLAREWREHVNHDPRTKQRRTA